MLPGVGQRSARPRLPRALRLVQVRRAARQDGPAAGGCGGSRPVLEPKAAPDARDVAAGLFAGALRTECGATEVRRGPGLVRSLRRKAAFRSVRRLAQLSKQRGEGGKSKPTSQLV